MTEHDKQTPPTETASSQPAENTTAQTPPKAKAKTKPAKAAKKSGGGRGWRVLLILLILLGLLGGAGYYWGQPYYQAALAQWSQWRDLPQQQAALAQQIERLNNELDAERQARASLASDLQNSRSELEQMVVDTAQRLTRQDDLDANQWSLEEALALLRLAERRLQLDGNVQVALNLLDAADQVLANLSAAAVLPVRRQIAQDRLALQSIDAPDINGLYFRLDAIDERIAAFQWTPAERLAPQAQAQSDDEPLSPWAAFRNSLGSLVTVTRLDAPHQASPLLDDFERWRQHSRLLLEEVQLALLSREQGLFDATLAQLTEQLTPLRQELDVEPLIEQLNQLAGTQLNPTLPDISPSVRALENYLSRSGDAEGDL